MKGIKALFGVGLAFLAMSCSDVRFKKSEKDACLGDSRGCTYNPDTRLINFDINGSVPYPDTRTDILFVVDNSKSMLDEQEGIASRFTSFLSSINNLDWRMAMVTTDTRVGSAEYMDAKLVPFKYITTDVTKILDKNTPNFEYLFQNTVRRPETIQCINLYNAGKPYECNALLNGDERGIYSIVKVLGRRGSDGFLRSGVPLHTVIISDENERSNMGQYPSLPMVDGQDFADDLVTAANSAGIKLTNHSIIVPSNDGGACLNQQQNNRYNDSAFAGTEYEKLSNLTGGRVESICAGDYSSALSAIGRDVSDGTQDAIDGLPCVPSNNQVELYVPANSTQAIIVNNVTRRSFSVSPVLQPGQTYRIKFSCLPY